MKLDKKYKFVIIAAILLSLWVVFAETYRIELSNKHLVGQAIVTNCHLGGRGNANYFVDGYFYVDNKRYKTSVPLSCSNLNVDNLNARLVGRKFMVLYNPDEPSNNILLLEKKTFDLYNIQMPDSMKLILDFLSCK